MSLGRMEDRHLAHVPGTTLFRDDYNLATLAQSIKDASAEKQLSDDLGRLKHARGKNSHIVLVPQHSDDPNDPLNWPIWKKHLVRLPLILQSFSDW